MRYRLSLTGQLALVLALCATAASSVGAPREGRTCDPQILEAVALKAWSRGEDEPLDFRASVCKMQPQNRAVLLVAIAEAAPMPTQSDDAADIRPVPEMPDTELTKVDMAVAMVDAHTKTVLATHAWQVEEDSGFRVDETSLRLDAANYWLNGDTLAFGLDVRSGYIPHCGDGDTGAERTLFIREGSALRPVLSALTMSSRQFIVVSGRCNWGSKTSITAEFNLSLSFAEERHGGMRDLVVTMRSRRDDGKPAPSKPLRLQVPYDGKRYPKEVVDRAYHAWRVWVEPPKHE